MGLVNAISNTIGSYQRPVSGSNNYFVQLYSPALAFSFRKLSNTATLCVRIRRDSDNAEQDIGFNGDIVDAAAIVAFCTTANGWVTTWYDQSGNGLDVVQATAARQPKLYNGTTVYTVAEGFYALNMTTGLGWLDYSNPNQNTLAAVSVFSVNTRGTVSANNRPAGFREDPNNAGVKSTMAQTQDGTLRYDGAASSAGSVSLPATALYLRSSFKTNTNQWDYIDSVNSVTDTTITIDNTSESVSIGNAVGAQGSPCFNGEMCEAVFFHSNVIAQRTDIETNINDYYSVY